MITTVATSQPHHKIDWNFLKFFYLNKNPNSQSCVKYTEEEEEEEEEHTCVLYAQNWLKVLISWRFVQAEQLPKVVAADQLQLNW
jgi:hypothetical protein